MKKSITWETIKLKFLITFSKSLPAEFKNSLKNKIIGKFEFSDISLNKGILKSRVWEDSYDIFTSSILCLHYRNIASFNILNRAQIENFFLTCFIIKKPYLIKDIFSNEVYFGEEFKNFLKEEKEEEIKLFREAYDKYYSKKAHPFPTRFVSKITFYSFLKPKKEGADITPLIDKSFNKLPEEIRKKFIEDTFEFGSYSPGINSSPHNLVDREIIQESVIQAIYLYDRIIENLNKILVVCDNSKMSDEEWNRSRRKYEKKKLFPEGFFNSKTKKNSF